MSFKTILVNLNETEQNSLVLNVAANLAARFEAHLTGLYVIPAARIYPQAGFEPIPEIFAAHREYFKERAASAGTAFEKAVQVAGIPNGLRIFDSSSPLISDLVIEHGRAADLIIVSQTDTRAASGVELDFVERVAMAVGRPVLVVPQVSMKKVSLDTIVIGWNARREAARAAFDSLPLLRYAKDVRIVWVDPQKEFYDQRGVLPGAELAETLSRHGVNAVVEPTPSGGQESGKALLQKVSDLGAGLLVMGTYGHTRLREFIVGGATRSVLKKMNCAVLFSH